MEQGWGWGGAAQDPQGHQCRRQPNAKAAARRRVPHPQLLRTGPGGWARSGSWREEASRLTCSQVSTMCFPPAGRGGPRTQHPAGGCFGLLCPSPLRRDGEGCPLPAPAGAAGGCGWGARPGGRGGAEMRRVPGTGGRVAAPSLAADFKVKCVRFLTLTKGRRKER